MDVRKVPHMQGYYDLPSWPPMMYEVLEYCGAWDENTTYDTYRNSEYNLALSVQSF